MGSDFKFLVSEPPLNIIGCRLTPLGGKFENILALHEEVSNTLLLVDPVAGSVLKLDSSNFLSSVKDFKDRLTGAGRSAAEVYRLKTGE